MTLDIFSSFDDHNKVFIRIFYIVWAIPLILLMSFFRTFRVFYTFKVSFLRLGSRLVGGLVSSTGNRKNIGSSVIVPTLLFFLYILLNLWGLAPYVFRATRHLALNLRVAFVIWYSIIVISVFYRRSRFFSHLLPAGRPSYLAPFLCLIELVSIIVRPVTLAVRLTANITTGHILIGLLARSFAHLSLGASVVILSLGIFYHMFEFAVCIIQAYIFVLLSNLYADEHPSY